MIDIENTNKLIEELLKQDYKPQENLTPFEREELLSLKEERELRGKFARWWFIAIVVQLGLLYIILSFMIFFGSKIDAISLRIFISATIAESFGIVFIITRYLFPIRKTKN